MAAFLACGKPAPPPAASPAPAGQTQAPAASPTPSVELVAALRAWLARPDPYFDPSARAQKVLSQIYPDAAEAPLWVDGSLRPTKSAGDVLAVLNDAAAEGLDPADYRAADLAALGKKLLEGSPPSVRDAAAFDASMSASVAKRCTAMASRSP